MSISHPENPLYVEDTVLAPGAVAGSGDSGILESYAAFQTLHLHIVVTALNGATVQVFVDDTLDGTNFKQIASQGTVGAGVALLDVTVPFAERIRVRWTVSGGTPDFGIYLSAKAVA